MKRQTPATPLTPRQSSGRFAFGTIDANEVATNELAGFCTRCFALQVIKTFAVLSLLSLHFENVFVSVEVLFNSYAQTDAERMRRAVGAH